MTKPELVSHLQSQYRQLTDYANQLTDEQFTFAPTGKWSAGQQIDHLARSVAPLNKVMASRAIVESFGAATQASRDHDDVVAFYLSALSNGGKASGKFVPEANTSEQRVGLMGKLSTEVDRLCELLDTYSEEDLDHLVIPHPLLGNLTMREMMCFTIYHGVHHELGIKKILI